MKTALGLLVLLSGSIHVGCSLGQGEGRVYSERLLAHDCWDRAYDMQPDFFAAVPYRETLQIRVQRGNDLQEVSDGLAILIDDVERIRTHIAAFAPDCGSDEVLEDEGFNVSLPPGVTPPGAVVEPLEDEDGPLVHMSLYLQQSCHNQNTVLYSIGGKICFNALFSGDPHEDEGAEKYTDATFKVTVGDPRDAPLGKPATDIPVELQSTVVGNFRFYFERGQPGQPFP